MKFSPLTSLARKCDDGTYSYSHGATAQHHTCLCVYDVTTPNADLSHPESSVVPFPVL